MSNRPLSARGRRSEKDGANADSTSRHDVKSGEFSARPRIPQNDKSPVPSRGGRWQTSDRADSSSSTRFSLGKPKERDDSSVARRRSTDKTGGGFGGKGGRRMDTGHGGQRGNGQSEATSGSATHGGGKLFISREFVTTGDLKSTGDGGGGKPFMDDSRLSKLVRRAGREDERERRLLAIRQLKDYLLQAENAKGIVKMADSLLVALQDMFYERTYKELKQEAAHCIGIVGSVMGSDAQRYLQWLFAKLTAAPTDEAKILFLKALLQTLEYDDNRRNLADFMPMITSNTQGVLENADLPELLVAVVDIIQHIVARYPQVFSSHFRDTVDILVGWHIDATQKETLTNYTSNALVSFHQFWLADIHFSLTLLGQFLEDLEAYAEDLGLGLSGQGVKEEEVPTPEECITKIAALLRVYGTVVKSLGEFFTPEKQVQFSWEYIVENLERIVKCVDSTVNKLYSENVLTAANSCLLLLIGNLGNGAVRLKESTLLSFVVQQCQMQRSFSNKYLGTLLTLTHRLIELLTTNLPVVFLTDLLGPQSLLHRLRFAHSKEMLASLMSVYHIIMGIKNVPLLEEAYRHVLGDLEVAYNVLLHHAASDYRCHLVPADHNPFSAMDYDIEAAEAAIVFDVCALAEIGNAKNNLIGMWALSPSIFDLLAHRLLPSKPSVLVQYPAVQFVFLQILYSHCSRHGHFISSSNLITQNTILEGSLLANVSPSTGGHFSTVLQLLHDLLGSNVTPYDSSVLALKWVQEVTEALANLQHIYNSQEFHNLVFSLITLGYSDESDISIQACQCLVSILKSTNNCHTVAIIKRCAELCWARLSETNSRVREEFLSLRSLLPTTIIPGLSNNSLVKSDMKKSSEKTDDHMSSYWLARHGHMTRTPTATFQSHHFRSVMAFLLHDIAPSKMVSEAWLERIYYSCQRGDKERMRQISYGQLSKMIGSNSALQWFWVTWEAAQFCVLAKLRTPLGKPQDTFTMIEAVLKKYSAESAGKDGDDVKTKPNGGESQDGHNTDWDDVYSRLLRPCALLQFMEYLEKLLYNAYEGYAVAMPSPPKVVRTFFRTNRNTCQEWMTRVRQCVMSVAAHCGQTALVVWHAFELLRDMEELGNVQGAEFEHVVMQAVQVLCQLHCPEAILGLYAWCRDVTGIKMTWVKAAAEVASGRGEVGVTEFKTALRAYIVPPDSNIEELRDSSNSRSQSGSPVGSPKHCDAMQKFSILSKHQTYGAATSNGTTQVDGPDPVIAGFMVRQICESYLQLDDWQDILEWQETLQQYRNEHTGTALYRAFIAPYDMNYIKALSSFDEQDFETVRAHLELVPGMSVSDVGDSLPQPGIHWDTHDVISTATKQFVRAVTLCTTARDWRADIDKISLCLEESIRWSTSVLRCGALWWPYKLDAAAQMILNMAEACQRQLDSQKHECWLVAPCVDGKLDTVEQDVGSLTRALHMLRLQAHLHTSLSLEDPSVVDKIAGHVSDLRLATVRIARRQHNLHLAENLLVDEICSTTSAQSHDDGAAGITSAHVALGRIYTSNSTVERIKLLRIEREVAKLLHARGQHRDAIETLSTSIVNEVTGNTAGSKDIVATCQQLNTRSLLSLVQWLQLDHKNLVALASQLKVIGQGDEVGVTVVARNVKALLELEEIGACSQKGLVLQEYLEQGHTELHIGENPVLSEGDAVIGRLLHLGSMHCPTLGKSWFTLAGWCYKWGRKAVDNATHGSIEFSSQEKSLIHTLLPKGTSVEDTDSVLKILSQLHTAVGSDEDISDQDQSLYDDGAETARRQLLSSCLSLQVASDECVDRLLSVWQDSVRRLYSYYQLSAKAYFTYVRLSAQDTEDLTAMDGNITATLRILRLLVKHAWELRGVLEDGLAHTPTAPWKGIIPQLFSRLNHPEPYVRQSVSELLCRVAHDAPHLIVYPSVVGCSSNKVLLKDSLEDALLNDYLSENEDEKLDPEHSTQQEIRSPGAEEEMQMAEDSNNAVLQNCFAAIVDTLAHTNPQMISDVQLLVSELRRITLLWDELWLGTLNQHHQDVTRRLTQLDNEIKKVMNNSSLSADLKTTLIAQKHSVLLQPTVFTMERLYDITRQPPETEHERWFQKTYGKVIESALTSLKNPPNPATPHASWLPFKQLHHSLQQRAQKRSSLVLNMEEISNKLASLKSSVIAMPGLSSEGQMVNIDSIHNIVQILPTKTKPKKLVFIGSDGNKYTYLFKGLEDLHLDERIMQFLSIVNNMFAKANRNEQRRYHARHYSVTPLGARSGLIQWVDGATALFSLYKRWQQREAVAQQQKHQQQGASSQAVSSNPPTIPRPSEVYYSKLTPALKEKGVCNLENRKEWPLSVMRSVLEDLMDDTPKDLLSRELWGSSTSAAEWWQITQCYARSTAVMSMIGYIIGLGDRHLDNVLVDLTTGEVVHIDYNVCFEKGKGLRVPEKVPFRMTQNIEMAFGVTGVEGVFRLSCEHVVKTMRKGRETLLTLLEAFVYDPLVDWTTGNEGGYTGAFCGGGVEAVRNMEGRQSKKDMERDITLKMFAIRIAEMKTAWISNKEDMLASLPALKESVCCHVATQDELHTACIHAKQLQEQTTYLEEALSDPQHAFYTLPDRYSEFSLVKGTRLEVLHAIHEKLSECEQWHTAYKVALTAVQGNKLQKMCAQVSRPLFLAASSFDPVVDFLQSAGQAQMVTQCEQVTTEMSGVIHQQRAMLRSCLDVLHTYATIVSQYPPDYVENCRTSRWQHWLQEHIADFTSARCKQTVSEYEEVYGVMCPRVQSQVQTVLATEIKLQSIITDINDRLMKLVERRNLDATETSALTVHAQKSTTALHNFVREEGVGGAVSMTSVVVSALCSLAQRYIVMEGAAAAARDRLMDLTSRDGDWFLDELCSMSANVNQMVTLVTDPAMCQLASDALRQYVVLAMQTTHTVYLSLQDLNVNFRSIILPETLKCLASETPSVLAILASLDTLLDDVCGAEGVDSLLAVLEGQLSVAVDSGVKPLQREAAARVKQLRVRFEELLHGAPPPLHSTEESCELTAGQMLLMGFNGLFLQLEADFAAMLDAVTRLRLPDKWMTAVDILSEASALQVLTLTDQTRTVLSQLFFLKQLVALRQFFHMCQDSTQHKGPVSGPCYDDDHLARPVRHFIAEYVRKHMIGLPSQTLGVILCHYVSALNVDIDAEIDRHQVELPGGTSKVCLEDLCKRALELGQTAGTFRHPHLTQASSLIATLDLNWRKLDLARRLDSNAALLQSSLHRAQLDLARYQWLNEDVFAKAGCPLSQMTMPTRATVMSELRKGVQALVSHETAVLTVQERHLTLETSITQRLKWAAGANPSLSATLQQFEETLAANNAILQTEAALTTDAVTLCNAILHFEALRTRTTEALTADASFLSLINRCDECCQLMETCSSSVSELEENLMLNKLIPPSEKVTPELIKSSLTHIGEQITEVNGSLSRLRSTCSATKEGVRGQVGSIRGILTTHHKLMSDVRSILKSMAKQEEQDDGTGPQPGSVCQYVLTYKTFSENFTTVLKQVMADDITAGVLPEIDAMTGVLCAQINRIYDDLVKFAPPLAVGNMQSPLSFTSVVKKSDAAISLPAVSPKKVSTLQRSDVHSVTPTTPVSVGSPQTAPINVSTPVVRRQEKVTRDPRTGKAIQERNSYAVGVWKRIKMKLDGRDPEINRRLSVAEQVDYVIKEATDVDNLAVLYEGWTPWV